MVHMHTCNRARDQREDGPTVIRVAMAHGHSGAGHAAPRARALAIKLGVGTTSRTCIRVH